MAPSALDTEPGPYCTCCEKAVPEARLTRLGSHPEIGLCPACARWVYRQSRQRQDRLGPATAATRLRGVISRRRAAVVHHGWHDAPVVGRLLRGIDQLLA